MPLRQSSDPFCALPRMCAAFIKLAWVIEQTAHLHPYCASTWKRNLCWPGRTFVVAVRDAAPPSSSNGLSEGSAGPYLHDRRFSGPFPVNTESAGDCLFPGIEIAAG